jgi:hypothetical protein
MGIGSFPGVESGWGVTLTPHTLLVPWSKKQSRAIPLLSLKVFMAYKKCETYLPTSTTQAQQQLSAFQDNIYQVVYSNPVPNPRSAISVFITNSNL